MACPIALTSAGRGARAAGLLAALFFWWVAGQAALAASFVDYLYIEANESDSSGGHAAIRFGDETFHFQHESPGILRIQRQDAAVFIHNYAMLGNRSIHESRISVSDDTYALLRGAFVRLLMVQGAQLEIRDALHRDVTLIDLLLRQRRDPHRASDEISLPINGLGYFLADPPPRPDVAPTPFSPALALLRERISATYGAGFIAERADQARAGLRRIEPRAAARPLPEMTRDAFPAFDPSLSTRYGDSLSALFALELLQGAPALLEGTFWAPEDEAFRLEPQEALALKTHAARLEMDLVRLVDSPRADWGLPFILGMARLAAIEATLASGRLVLLDIFSPNDYLPPREDSALRPYLPMLENETREVFLQKRKKFFAAEVFREADYAAMERSGNLLLDIGRARTTGTALKAVPKHPFPSRTATVGAPPPGEADEATLERELAAAQAAERDHAAVLDRLYAYDLVRRNCVTEIFAVINTALAGPSRGHEAGMNSPATTPDAAARGESEKRLGGFVDARQGLAFIPFISADTVASSYAVVERRDRPSYRMARLAEMKTKEPPLKVFFRESNTITSSVYRPGPGDSAFLFFTDDTLLLRPLFGAFNLIAGLGEVLLGVLTVPFEGSDRLISGGKGVCFSLPELLFINFRKGSMAFVEQSPETDR